MNTDTETTLCSQSSCDGTAGDGGTARAVKPDFRVEPRDEGVSLHLALPGVSREQVSISHQDGQLRITADRTDAVPEGWRAHQVQERPSKYELVVRLHQNLDPGTAAAELRDGVLTVQIERHEAAKPREITVN